MVVKIYRFKKLMPKFCLWQNFGLKKHILKKAAKTSAHKVNLWKKQMKQTKQKILKIKK